MFEKAVKELIIKDAKLSEAFIVEELKPFLIKEGEELIYTHQLKVRLAEIDDFKQKVIEIVSKNGRHEGSDEVIEPICLNILEELNYE